jgi:hypothetical protein
MKEIELTNGGKTLVDDEDFDELNRQNSPLLRIIKNLLNCSENLQGRM